MNAPTRTQMYVKPSNSKYKQLMRRMYNDGDFTCRTWSNKQSPQDGCCCHMCELMQQVISAILED